MAPRNGGVTNEAITRRRMVRRSGMSVRATIQPSGAATQAAGDADRGGDDQRRSSGSTKAGSVNSVRKLASVTCPPGR